MGGEAGGEARRGWWVDPIFMRSCFTGRSADHGVIPLSYIFSSVGLLVTWFQRISCLITIQAILCLSQIQEGL